MCENGKGLSLGVRGKSRCEISHLMWLREVYTARGSPERPLKVSRHYHGKLNLPVRLQIGLQFARKCDHRLRGCWKPLLGLKGDFLARRFNCRERAGYKKGFVHQSCICHCSQ